MMLGHDSKTVMGKSILHYDPATGVFSRANGKPYGLLRPDGYLQIGHRYKKYLCHRLAWEMTHGPIPDGMYVDHINRKRDDNRICNLRLLSPKDSQFNTKAKASSKPQGVRFKDGRWEAYIGIGRKQVYLGRYETEKDARNARRKAVSDHWPGMSF